MPIALEARASLQRGFPPHGREKGDDVCGHDSRGGVSVRSVSWSVREHTVEPSVEVSQTSQHVARAVAVEGYFVHQWRDDDGEESVDRPAHGPRGRNDGACGEGPGFRISGLVHLGSETNRRRSAGVSIHRAPFVSRDVALTHQPFQ